MGIGLPVIVDIAISLIFVYFTLSLLSSEVQELLKTVLQWKAVHLKESIEGLLVGNADAPEQLKEARALANVIYSNPLIQSLNHSAKSTLASKMAPRLTQVFGEQSSGPSYIPPQTFSTSLLNTFDFLGIYRKLIAYRLELKIKSLIPNPDDYNQRLKEEVDAILAAFVTQKLSLNQTVQKIAEEAKEDEAIFDKTEFSRYFGSLEAVDRLTAKIQISLGDVIRTVRLCLELRKNETFQGMIAGLGQNPSFATVKTAVENLQETDPEFRDLVPKSVNQAVLLIALICTNPALQFELDRLPKIPPVLLDNFERLADTALAKVGDLVQEGSQFEQEVADWFDRSMTRAKGVYRRNAKLIGILIAIVVAIAANADTFYMVDRFAKSTTIQAAVVQAATEFTPAQLEDPNTLNQLSANLTLPIGWDQETCQNQKASTFFLFRPLPFALQRFPGWLVTGLAISMGSSFWYELLRKLVDIRSTGENSGKTPAPVVASASVGGTSRSASLPTPPPISGQV